VDSDGIIVTEQQLLDGTGNTSRDHRQDDLPWGLQFILQKGARQQQQQPLHTTDNLKKILLEAKPHRSKWYDQNRPGQGELYDALERVLNELRAFTPHSIPFLHRVSKKDVPDYHTIIFYPMDFGTMGKKLRGFEYRSKADFVSDLNLIYDNCMTFNTAEESPLRVAVRLLREKWTLLLNKVPDITIGFGVPASVEEDSIDAILDAELKNVSYEASQENVNCGGSDEYKDNDDNEDEAGVTLMWPRRSPELMDSFRKAHQSHRDLDIADMALSLNGLPDTWTVVGRPQHNHTAASPDPTLFNKTAIEEMLECCWLYDRAVSVAPFTGCPRLENTLASRRVSLKLAGLIMAAHGCDGI
jgi:hypothetical protein